MVEHQITRFLLQNLKGNGKKSKTFKYDQYFLILDEKPLGRLNKEQIKFHFQN